MKREREREREGTFVRVKEMVFVPCAIPFAMFIVTQAKVFIRSMQ